MYIFARQPREDFLVGPSHFQVCVQIRVRGRPHGSQFHSPTSAAEGLAKLNNNLSTAEDSVLVGDAEGRTLEAPVLHLPGTYRGTYRLQARSRRR